MDDQEDNIVEDDTQEEQVDTTEEVSEPELILGKFKSQDDLATAYKELESKATKTSQEKAELERLLTPKDEPQPQPEFVMEDGTVDPFKLLDTAVSTAERNIERKLQGQRAAEDDWREAVKAHPELAENPKLAEMVRATRLNRIVEGKVMSSKEVAADLLSLFTKAEQTGKEIGHQEAEVSERIVNRSTLAEPSAQTDTSQADKEELQERMKSRDHEVARQARIEYLSKM